MPLVQVASASVKAKTTDMPPEECPTLAHPRGAPAERHSERETMRTYDELAEAAAYATTPEEMAAIEAEIEALNSEVAAEHLADGNIAEYQRIIGR